MSKVHWYLSYHSCDPHHTYPVLKPQKVIKHTSLIVALINNGFTGIDQPNIYSRGLKMTKQKQMTEKELDQISGGPHYTDFNGRPGVMGKREFRDVMGPDYKVGFVTRKAVVWPEY